MIPAPSAFRALLALKLWVIRVDVDALLLFLLQAAARFGSRLLEFLAFDNRGRTLQLLQVGVLILGAPFFGGYRWCNCRPADSLIAARRPRPLER